ncbi:MAG TPA: hypothetical protein VHK28_06155 [Candidatus Limnocylindria bacterium]|nr:hypothetical protein [Candidatus Limnocylindria bacterium]
MFGRRKQKEAAEAAREAERRALFEELAKRPDTICPFLGLAEARTKYKDGVTDEHRCYAFGDPAELSHEQQQKVCLQRGYGNCPRYLRGVLVIPTEELEALRRPQPLPPPSVPGEPEPAGGERGGRRPLAALLLVLLLAVGVGGAGAFFLLGDRDGFGSTTPTPGPTATPLVTAASSEAPAPTTASQSAAPTATPAVTPPPEATPAPEDTFIGYEVIVPAGQYTVYRVDDAGEIVDQLGTSFNDWSPGEVGRIVAENGLLHWRTLSGGLTGWSYIRGQTATFFVREVFQAPDGSRSYELLPEEDL